MAAVVAILVSIRGWIERNVSWAMSGGSAHLRFKFQILSEIFLVSVI